MGGSPGLVVMGGDSRYKGHGFESRRRILDGHDIFTLICCKNCIVCLKRTKINEKEAVVGTFFKNTIQNSSPRKRLHKQLTSPFEVQTPIRDREKIFQLSIWIIGVLTEAPFIQIKIHLSKISSLVTVVVCNTAVALV